MPFQREELRAGFGVPDPDGLVRAPRRQALPVGAEGDGANALAVPLQRHEFKMRQVLQPTPLPVPEPARTGRKKLFHPVYPNIVPCPLCECHLVEVALALRPFEVGLSCLAMLDLLSLRLHSPVTLALCLLKRRPQGRDVPRG